MTESTENKPEQKPRKRLPWRGIGITFSTFAVLILLIIFFFSNFYYLQHLEKFSSSQNMLQQVQKNQVEFEQKIEDELKSQNEIINTLRQSQTGFNRNEWRVLEAEFLVRLASEKLQFESHIPQAILLLETADQHIRDLNDNSLLSLRKALATDIANLQALPKLDMPGIYTRLTVLNEQVNRLTFPAKSSTESQIKTSEDASLPWWKRGLAQTAQALKQIVIVRYNQNTKLPLVTPEQQNFIYQNLHAVVENAIWGLLHQQPDIYRNSLQQTENWIKKYFVIDTAEAKSVLTEIEQLQQVNVRPDIPKKLDSLQAFQEFFASRGNQTKTQSDTSTQ